MASRESSSDVLIREARERLALTQQVLREARRRVRKCRRGSAARMLNPQDRDLMNLLMSLEDARRLGD
ncbi:MAG TPA: hypothetical protein VLJ39_23115 [Tepidisphaeraceae bacterium]|nr:hypothetical protein [Tepidisphaeraceae bacterium]